MELALSLGHQFVAGVVRQRVKGLHHVVGKPFCLFLGRQDVDHAVPEDLGQLSEPPQGRRRPIGVQVLVNSLSAYPQFVGDIGHANRARINRLAEHPFNQSLNVKLITQVSLDKSKVNA